MKAYLIGTTAGDDVCHDIVFANTVREAKVLANANYITDESENWIDIYAKRAPEFDDMENATKDEIYLKKFREGWIWWDESDQPHEENTTDQEFYQWLKSK